MVSGSVRFVFFFLFAFVGFVHLAFGEEPLPRVALVVETEADPVARRLRAELVALGFDVVDVAAEGEAGRETLEAVARAAGAVAALRVVPSEEGVEVWIVDRVTGKTVLREVVTADSMSPAEDVVPVRAVELLRASLMEIDAPHEVHGEVPPPPNIRAIVPRPRPPPPPPPRFALSLGAALLGSPGDPASLSSAGDVRLALRWRPLERLGATVLALVPTIPARLETADPYRTYASPWLVGAGLDGYFAERRARWTPTAGLGIGLVVLRMVGQGTFGQVDSIVSTAPYVMTGIGYAVSSRLTVGAEALAAWLLPEAVVAFQVDERDIPIASWGHPLLAVSLSATLAI
jgi:hypothetical protein